MSATTQHKLSPRSIPCVFLRYPSSHKGYRCLDPSSGKVILSRHVVFDESVFRLAHSPPLSDLSPPIDEPNLAMLDPLFSSSTPHTPPTSPIHSSLATIVAAPPSPVPPPLSPQHSPPPALPTHPMQTRSKSGIQKHKIPFSLTVTSPTASHLPLLINKLFLIPSGAMPCLTNLMRLLRIELGNLFPAPHPPNIIGGKWLFRHKYLADGTLARWVARGFTQVPCRFDETFSPVVKTATVRTVLSLALSRSWPIN